VTRAATAPAHGCPAKPAMVSDIVNELRTSLTNIRGRPEVTRDGAGGVSAMPDRGFCRAPP
jgi:hypothetical protein